MKKAIQYGLRKEKNGHCHLVRGAAYPYDEPEGLRSPERISQMMEEVFGISSKAEEYAYMLALDIKCHLLGVFEVSHGALQNTIVDPRSLFVRALLCNAASIVLIHNHPSGDTSPSKDDILLTERIKKAGEILGVPLTDHLILGDGNFYSFHENE